jgi:putative PIN family toxin of toxin-antitoxin system
MKPRVVLDTNVIVSAFRSRRGASYRLLELAGEGAFTICLSVPLVLEYEDASKRLISSKIDIRANVVDDVLDYLCAIGEHHDIFFLWRPHLRDPKDDMLLELAVSAGCEQIVTYNERDFVGADQFGIKTITPRVFLASLGV